MCVCVWTEENPPLFRIDGATVKELFTVSGTDCLMIEEKIKENKSNNPEKKKKEKRKNKQTREITKERWRHPSVATVVAITS